jgi:hypothetical protein
VEDIGEARGTSAADAGEAARRNADAHGRGEHAGYHVGDPVSAEFGIRVGALEVLMAPAKVFHHARRDQNIDGADEGQSEGGGKHMHHIRGRPRKAGEGWNLEGQLANLLLANSERRRGAHRGEDADQRRGGVGTKCAAQRRRRSRTR